MTHLTQQMECPADLISSGDLIARSPGGPWGVVRSARHGESRSVMDVLVDHGAGQELETWRPRPDSTVHLWIGAASPTREAARHLAEPPAAKAIRLRVHSRADYATAAEVAEYEQLAGSRFTESPDGVLEGGCVLCLAKAAKCECGQESR